MFVIYKPLFIMETILQKRQRKERKKGIGTVFHFSVIFRNDNTMKRKNRWKHKFSLVRLYDD